MEKGLQSEFLLDSPDDAERVLIECSGVESLSIDGSGSLLLHLTGGGLIRQRPLGAQFTGSDGKLARGHFSFRLLGQNTFGISTAALPLSTSVRLRSRFEFKPFKSLQWSTFLGGVSTDDLRDVAVAQGVGNAHVGEVTVVGCTLSNNFPAFLNSAYACSGQPYQSAYSLNPADIFVTRLTADGTAVIYSTFIGSVGINGLGLCHECANGVDLGIDDQGRETLAVLTGEVITRPAVDGTLGCVFPVSVPPAHPNPAFDVRLPKGPFLNPTTDAFVLQLDSCGTTINYASLIGGDENEIGCDVAVFQEGGAPGAANVVATVVGRTLTDDAGSPANPFPTGTHLSGTVIQPNFGGPPLAWDGFVTRLRLDTTLPPTAAAGQPQQRRFSTYFGGFGTDEVRGVDVDSSGVPTVVGLTTSMPATYPFTWLNSLTGVQDGFIARIEPAGRTVLYATYIGGDGLDAARNVAIFEPASG